MPTTFFEYQPLLAASIDQIHLPGNCASAERAAIILFVRIYVALIVAQVMLNISVESPLLFTPLGIEGLGSAPAVGRKTGELTEKALDKFTTADED